LSDSNFADSALRLWRNLNPGDRDIETVALKETRKSAVYRLTGTGVIAKRTKAPSAARERAIYMDVLPRLPVSGLKCFGLFSDDDPAFSWLLLQDSQGSQWLPENGPQRGMLSAWTSSLHAAATDLDIPGLPVYDAASFLVQLQAARTALIETLDHIKAPDQDVALIRTGVTYCDRVESRWSVVEELCSTAPSTLVHGDIKPKNVHFNGDVIFLLDWELTGWGMPMPDLHCLDLDVYRSYLGVRWRPTPETLRSWHAAGMLFRQTSAIVWACSFARYGQTDKGMRRIRPAVISIEEALRTLGLP